jgi:ABC-type nitrate/sulfonate/bicarbonate transport system substrate-binding protein
LTAKNANDWVAYIGDRQGFFAANGVNVAFVVTGSAAANAQQLTAGALDLAGISSSQVVEAVEGGAPLRVVLNRTYTSPYVIVGRKGLHSIKDLKGKMIIVGGPNDVTTILMNGVLAGNGLTPDNVTYTYAGGTPERFAALMSGAVDAAILVPPFSFRATDQGYPQLSTVAQYFPSFPLDLVATNMTWARTHADTLEGYLRGYLQAVRWLSDPANHDRAVAVLVDQTNSLPDDAAKSYDAFVKAKVFNDTGITPLDGLDKVIGILGKIGVLKPPLPPASKYVDNHFVQNAQAELKAKR